MASYANIAKKNRVPLFEQPKPDPAFLETPTEEVYSSQTINIVQSKEELEALRIALESPPPAPEPVLLAAPTLPPSLKQSSPEIYQSNLERLESELSAGAPEFKPSLKKIEKVEKEAEATAKKINHEVLEKKEQLKKAAVRKNDEFKDKAKALEREGRSLARRYPAAVTGVIGLFNASILATVGVISYQNWDRRAYWDRRTVSATAVGLLAVFGGQGWLGYYEYEKTDKK